MRMAKAEEECGDISVGGGTVLGPLAEWTAARLLERDFLIHALGCETYKDALSAIKGLQERVKFTATFEELKFRLEGLDK